MTTNYVMDMKKHDTGPPVRAQVLSAANGQPIDFDGATILFLMYGFDDDGTRVPLVSSAAVIETPSTDGFIRYDWIAGDTDIVGNHQALFEVTYSDATKESYPRRGYIEVRIEDDLNDV